MQNLGGQTKSIMVFSEVAYCVRTKERSRGREDKFAFFFVCTKEIENLTSQPRLCSFVFAKFESGLLKHIFCVFYKLGARIFQN